LREVEKIPVGRLDAEGFPRPAPIDAKAREGTGDLPQQGFIACSVPARNGDLAGIPFASIRVFRGAKPAGKFG
jgi:hypothetical protein